MATVGGLRGCKNMAGCRQDAGQVFGTVASGLGVVRLLAGEFRAGIRNATLRG